MPVIQVTLISGYDDAAKQRLCERLTDAAMAVIDAPADAVTVAITDVAPAGYMRGRTPKTPGAALRPPADVALEFLEAQGKRDLDRARALCAQGFEMVFPGADPFTSFDDLIAWSGPRYRSISKTIDRVEEALQGGSVAVFVTGMLHGVLPDGERFEGIRFIDRFQVRGGLIERQEVWNDLTDVLGPLGASKG